LLSVVIPCRNEESAIPSAVEHLYVELRLHGVPHEIVAVDDGSTDSTWPTLEALCQRVPTLRPVRNTGENGFGRACVKKTRKRPAVRKMKAGPSKPPCGGRLQTAGSCFGQKPRW
jgi:glycosyltransferase involved in cell wall biosynthesis